MGTFSDILHMWAQMQADPMITFVDQMQAHYKNTHPDPIATYEVDGVRYEVYDKDQRSTR